MTDVDLPLQDESLKRESGDVLASVRAHALDSLFFFANGVLQYKDMTHRAQGRLCEFLTRNPAQLKIALIPRDHFKTTVGTISGSLWLLARNPDERILIASETALNASRFLRAIRVHAESGRVLRTLFSSLIPVNPREENRRWNDESLDFNRRVIVPEPSIDTVGMTGTSVSRHFTRIIVDDPISEEAIKSPRVMEDTISRFSSFISLFVHPEENTLWLIGTRWAYNDLYSWAFEKFGGRAARLIMGCYDSNGDPIFPERMSKELLDDKRRILGEYRFSCQYENAPRNEEVQDLHAEGMQRWRWRHGDQNFLEILHPTGEVKKVWHVNSLDVTVAVDLASSEKLTSDRNAITTVGMTPDGDAVILDVFAKRCPPGPVMDHLIYLSHRFQPRITGIEGVAYQKTFKWFLKEECERRGTWIHTKELTATGKKEGRIRGLQPLLQSHRLYCLPSETLLLSELSQFPLGEHDDIIDSLSMHLQLFQHQLSARTIARRASETDRVIARLLGKDPERDVLDTVFGQNRTTSYRTIA